MFLHLTKVIAKSSRNHFLFLGKLHQTFKQHDSGASSLEPAEHSAVTLLPISAFSLRQSLFLPTLQLFSRDSVNELTLFTLLQEDKSFSFPRTVVSLFCLGRVEDKISADSSEETLFRFCAILAARVAFRTPEVLAVKESSCPLVTCFALCLLFSGSSHLV